MTLARKPLPPLTRAKLPPLPRRNDATSDLNWRIDTKAPPRRTGRGVCDTCAGRGHLVWHEWHNIKVDCTACGGTGGAL